MRQESGPSNSDTQTSITHAVQHYSDILHYLIIDSLYGLYKQMYITAKCVPYDFQQLLKGIKDWNKGQIDGVVNSFLEHIQWTKEDFDNLITALFVGYSQMLTSVNLKNEAEDFVLRIPSYETFIHTIMVISAERIFRNPYIFKGAGDESGCEIFTRVEDIIQRSCKTAVYTLLPLKPILNYSNKEPSKEVKNTHDSSDSDDSDFVHNSDSDSEEHTGNEIKQIPLGDSPANHEEAMNDQVPQIGANDVSPDVGVDPQTDTSNNMVPPNNFVDPSMEKSEIIDNE